MAELAKMSRVVARVLVDGKDIADATPGSLSELRVSLPDHGPARFEAIFVGASPHWGMLKAAASGARIAIQVGYADEPPKVFEGEATAVRHRGRRGAVPMMLLEGADLLHRLDRGFRQRVLLDVTDGDLVKKLSEECGLSVGKIEDPGFPYPSVFQYNQTNLEFLMDRARRLGLCLWAEGDKVFFKARGQGEAGAALEYGSDLTSFHVRSTVAHVAPTVEIRGWDPQGKEERVSKAKTGEETLVQEGGKAGTEVAKTFVPGVVTLGDVLPRSNQEAEAMAKGQLLRRSMGFSLATATIVGRPEIKPGSRVEIKGLTPKECGSYHVGIVTHRWTRDGGFQTELRLRRNHLPT